MQKNSGRQIRREIKGGYLGEKVGKKLGEKMGEKTGEKVGESLGEIHKLKLCRIFLRGKYKPCQAKSNYFLKIK